MSGVGFIHRDPDCGGLLKVQFWMSQERDEGRITYFCTGCAAAEVVKTDRGTVERALHQVREAGLRPVLVPPPAPTLH